MRGVGLVGRTRPGPRHFDIEVRQYEREVLSPPPMVPMISELAQTQSSEGARPA